MSEKTETPPPSPQHALHDLVRAVKWQGKPERTAAVAAAELVLGDVRDRPYVEPRALPEVQGEAEEG